ncbi:hypothetical protein CLPU_1c03690 [Gottschalkia purinilytica]|uniref:Sulfate exporter family transporter n=1 Tax=Gottschalkia purinilytica TaxID=1503 RepID=A0A0L0WFF9_GOTPU|nr:putative sulfate exporter family transporter [Gottschalkia purinilytica]KNF10204.1 hypothetical protein CLPU_1c03690 [Gottschalkia purinilytica]
MILKLKNSCITIIPGLIVCSLIAYISNLISTFLPSLGASPIAIFLGLLIGNTFGNKDIYKKGVKFSERDLLSYSIVLLGGTLSINAILELGISGVCFIIIQMIITILGTILIGRSLNFSQNFRLLMASGNAVCGSSAIAATSPVINSNDEDKAISITIVNLIGTILMFILPIVAKLLFSHETVKTSALIGGILQSVGQVVGSGSMVNEQVKDLSTIFKIVRIIFLVFVILSFSIIKKKSSDDNTQADKTNTKSKLNIPWYIFGFFITCSLYSIGIISPYLSKVFKTVSNNFEIIALAGIGMSVNFKTLIKQGLKSSVYALLVAIIQILSAVLLIDIFI